MNDEMTIGSSEQPPSGGGSDFEAAAAVAQKLQARLRATICGRDDVIDLVFVCTPNKVNVALLEACASEVEKAAADYLAEPAAPATTIFDYLHASLPAALEAQREKLAEAQKGMDFRQYDKAIYLIEQSEINSELAIEKSKTALVRAQVTENVRENEILREDYESTYGEDFR